MKKAVIVKSKANLRLQVTTKDIDQQCPYSFRSANYTIAKNQGQLIKDPQKKEPKVWAPKLTIPRSEPFAKAR